MDQELSGKLFAHIEGNEGLTLQELISIAGDFKISSDLIYLMITSKKILWGKYEDTPH
ncbi:hypothetical protein PTQ21_27935 [Paenibacillus marchantiae]|uniref:hypothetical protein n=1 Tax=Paenibacillus marchantiae TaxID=3026433 RepID=UPI00237C1D07|nr:hypothetical protein [Paenibacillus marchantiae]WDQ32167.1 hypothetical protein PTQ21_27935 [Paenibacillus marchantiae]